MWWVWWTNKQFVDKKTTQTQVLLRLNIVAILSLEPSLRKGVSKGSVSRPVIGQFWPNMLSYWLMLTPCSSLPAKIIYQLWMWHRIYQLLMKPSFNSIYYLTPVIVNIRWLFITWPELWLQECSYLFWIEVLKGCQIFGFD